MLKVNMLVVIVVLFILMGETPLCLCNDGHLQKQTNLILIMFDDLRPELKVYGRKHMITPNFDRLAAKSVIFDYSNCQVAVCNPSRDSLLTGLRPDTMATYGFQNTFGNHMIFPKQFALSGYLTAGYGKILHWDGSVPEHWNFDFWGDDWYEYQNKEWAWLNSSVMPDKVTPESEFRDHIMTTKAIDGLTRMHATEKHFMLAIGYKLPHITLQVPYKYYEMYKTMGETWDMTSAELSFPTDAAAATYKCCGEEYFGYMNGEGSKKSVKVLEMNNININVPVDAHRELMMGYSAAVTFLDSQLGRLLDRIDELRLWENATIILTSDHGMHNGEKGIWEKWTLFDEATRVPLFIYHPDSPFAGKHFSSPVELLDLYPTILDLVRPLKTRKTVCDSVENSVCPPLQGRSLGKIVLGPAYRGSHHLQRTRNEMALHKITSNDTHIFDSRLSFAMTQLLKCAPLGSFLLLNETTGSVLNTTAPVRGLFDDCNINTKPHLWWLHDFPHTIDAQNSNRIIGLMGYSMRTKFFRFTQWIRFDVVASRILKGYGNRPVYEELYDHRKESLTDYTHLELINLAHNSSFREIVSIFRRDMQVYFKRNPFHYQLLNI